MKKCYVKMLMELSQKNMINTIDLMEYAIRIENKNKIYNQYIVKSVKNRVTQLYKERVKK